MVKTTELYSLVTLNITPIKTTSARVGTSSGAPGYSTSYLSCRGGPGLKLIVRSRKTVQKRMNTVCNVIIPGGFSKLSFSASELALPMKASSIAWKRNNKKCSVSTITMIMLKLISNSSTRNFKRWPSTSGHGANPEALLTFQIEDNVRSRKISNKVTYNSLKKLS